MPNTLIIAEAGVNHNGDINIAKQLIEVAAKAGADYVKFQTFKTEKIISRAAPKAAYQIENTQNAQETQFDMVKKLELDEAAHHALMAHCVAHNIKFLSTAFDIESVDLLYNLGLRLFKIPSGEITNLPYLQKIGALKAVKIIVSTGMCTLGEVEMALRVLINAGAKRQDITVLHCNTEYPTPMCDVHLRAMQAMAHALQVATGYSDHTLGIEVPIAAVAMGAVCIEKHFTLDRTMPGPDHRASLEPAELIAMVQAIRNIERALGDPIKQPSPSETKNIVIARKSLHLAHSLPATHQLRAEDLSTKRPGNGISPMHWERVIGRCLKKALPINHQLQWTDLM